MEIQQLKGFQAVAKYRNFTLAARKTFRTQPTISLQVKALEDELGVRLFERLAPNKVHLTEEGRILLELISPILDDYESIRSRFDERRGVGHGAPVTIVTYTSIMVHLLPKVVRQFKHLHPDCQLVFLNRPRDELVSIIEAGEADFAVTALPNVPPTLNYEVFANFDRILITTKKHPLSQKSQVGLKDIAQYPLILPTQDSNTRKLIDRVFRDKNLDLKIAMEVLGREAVKTYVGMNLGISIINEYYVTKQDQEKLFVKNLSHIFGKAEMGIASRKRKYLSPRAHELMEIIRTTDYSDRS